MADPRAGAAPGALRARLLVALLLAVASCALLRGVREPEVSITRLRPAATGLLEQELELALRIRNPNEFPLEIVGLRVDLDVNGEPFASGFDDQRLTVPAYGEEELTIPARAGTLGMLRQLRRLGERAELSYELRGTLLLANEQAREVGFDRSGRALELE